jgi:hypothetical protein
MSEHATALPCPALERVADLSVRVNARFPDRVELSVFRVL